MRWFLRDKKFYIGPVSDYEMDALLIKAPSDKVGMACQAGSGKVETYVTIPTDVITINDLEKIRLGFSA